MKKKQKEKPQFVSYGACMGRVYNGFITVVKQINFEETEWMVYRVKVTSEFSKEVVKSRKGISAMRFWHYYHRALKIIKQ